MGTSFIQRITSIAAWGTLCAFFSLFVGSGAIVLALFLLVLLFGVIAIMLGPQFIAASWLVGSPTIFGFPNEILRPLPFVTMERLMLILLIAMIFLKNAFSKQKVQWLSIEIIILVFLVIALINLSFHTNKLSLSLDGWLWLQYMMPMASFIISRRIKWSEQGVKTLLIILTLTGVFVAVTGILQALFNINVFTMNYQNVTSGHSARAYGTFSNAHTYIATLFIFLTVTLLQYNLYKDAFVRFALLIAMAVMAVGIILGETRAPWIGAALAFAIIFVKHPQARPLMLIGGVFAFFAGMIIFVVMIDHMDSFMQRVTNLSTLAGRAAVWATAVNMIADNPIIGLGFGYDTFSIHKSEYITGIGSLSAQYAVYLAVPHNEYIHVAVMMGIPGVVLFVMILTRLVKLMFQIFHMPNETPFRRHLALYVAAITIALMFNSLFSDTYIQDYFWMLTYFLAGIAAGNLDLINKRSEDSLYGELNHD
jgi:O-antigen ligase